VRRVINNIEVLPVSPNDDRIRLRVQRSIADKGSLYRYMLGANPSIRIIVKNGRVMLEGYVANEADRNLANIAAREVSGTFEVTNNLKIEGREM
jgi:hyperosmotically inducible protein